jgi:hypothetical protein
LRRKPTLLLAVLPIAPFMAQADATIANVATPSLQATLRASGAALELVVGGYLVAFAVLLITDAQLGQTQGYRRLFIVGDDGVQSRVACLRACVAALGTRRRARRPRHGRCAHVSADADRHPADAADSRPVLLSGLGRLSGARGRIGVWSPGSRGGPPVRGHAHECVGAAPASGDGAATARCHDGRELTPSLTEKGSKQQEADPMRRIRLSARDSPIEASPRFQLAKRAGSQSPRH